MERNGPLDLVARLATVAIVVAVLLGLGYWALAGLMRVPAMP